MSGVAVTYTHLLLTWKSLLTRCLPERALARIPGAMRAPRTFARLSRAASDSAADRLDTGAGRISQRIVAQS